MPIKTAIIGTGRIGFLLEKDALRYHPCTHAGSMKSLNESVKSMDSQFELTGICDLKKDRMDVFENWWGKAVPLKTKDYRKLFEKEEIDFLVIASDFQTHYEIASLALEAGIRNIMLEKPACETAAQTEKLAGLAARKCAKVWVNFERRYHPGYRAVKTRIDQTPLEKLRSIRGRMLTGPVRSAEEGSPFLVDGIHWMDLLAWFFGEPDKSSINSIQSRYGPEDTTIFDFQYAGAFGRLEAGGRRKYFEFEMEIDYDDFRIVCGNSGFKLWINSASEKYERFYDLKPEKMDFEFKNPWEEMYREIRSSLVGQSDTVTSSLQDSLMVYRMMEA